MRLKVGEVKERLMASTRKSKEAQAYDQLRLFKGRAAV